MHKILITKRIEPYDILENLKQHCKMSDFTFDGFSKNDAKQKFLHALEIDNSFGLYMKNVNKFYIFDTSANVKEILIKKFELTESDYEVSEDEHKPFDDIDSGKAEASIITY